MAQIDLGRVWQVIADLVEGGKREDAELIKDLKDEYIRLQVMTSLIHASTHQPPFDAPLVEQLNSLSVPADPEAQDIFIRWDINLRKEKVYAVERGSAAEYHWAQFLINAGPVTAAMVEHASKADPEGWKQAQYELEEEGVIA